MTPAALLGLFRVETRDDVDPYLWSDAEVFSYMDDAQKMFCRLQGGIADASSALTQVAVTAGNKFASISPLILKIREAERASDGRRLKLLNAEDLEFGLGVDDYGIRSTSRMENESGEVVAIALGIEDNKIRLVQIPTANDTINLTVYRLPSTDITGGAQETLEIAAIHHRPLLAWMKHLAHLKQDADTYDRGKSEQFRAEFLAYCDQAKHERERREHKYRTVAYGGL